METSNTCPFWRRSTTAASPCHVIYVFKYQLVWITQGENIDESPTLRIAGIIRIANFHWLVHSCRNCNWLLVDILLPLNHTHMLVETVLWTACVLLVLLRALGQCCYHAVNYADYSRRYIWARLHRGLLHIRSTPFLPSQVANIQWISRGL
jgi:hypothetical protein